MPDAPTPESVELQLCREFETLMSLKSGSVTSETNLATLGVDSLRFVSLLLIIEQKFGVNLMKIGLKPTDMQTVRTLSAAILAGRQA